MARLPARPHAASSDFESGQAAQHIQPCLSRPSPAASKGEDEAKRATHSALAGCRDLPTSSVLQGNPLEHLRLRRVTVDRLGQHLERQLVGDCQREFADHFTGMRRDKRRSDNLTTAATGINRRKPLFLAVDKGALYLGQFKPILVKSETFFPGSAGR